MSCGSHIPVLLDAAVDSLKVRTDGVYVDCTFGGGGHSRRILEHLGPKGRLLAIDRDPTAVTARGEIDDPRLEVMHSNFGRLREILDRFEVAAADGFMFDLGVSSPQLDDPRRGFSFRFDAELDMRMDSSRGETAAEWLARASERDIGEVIRDYGEERFAKQIAAAIGAARARRPITTTRELAGIVADAVRTREPGQDPATRSFQALRIHINQELEELKRALPQAVDGLTPGGRLVVISFHSLEDRITKRFMRAYSQPEKIPPRLPLRAAELPQPKLKLIGKARRPDGPEIAANPRARSALMRVAERAGSQA